MPDDTETRQLQKHVAIFGGGISGLTAAHELIERGYAVTVYEPAEPSAFGEEACGLGGMARTQWWRAERAPGPGATARPPRRTARIPSEAERSIETTEIAFATDRDQLDDAARAALEGLVDRLRPYPELVIEIRGYTQQRDDHPSTDENRIDFRRAACVKAYLESRGLKNRFTAAALGFGHREDWTRSDAERCYVDFRTIEDWIPGEHGFRFFPSFYFNLRDTMGRIPIPEREEVFVETPWTVLDNIVATSVQGVNYEDRPSFELPRRRVTSIQELFDLLRDGLAASGTTLRDIGLMQLKLFKYMTSCTGRRWEYERLSWWEFVEGERYSPEFQRALDRTPEVLVAMNARECDARTYGNMQMQILLDQLSDGEKTDGTLNGPTSTAWFDHWRRYLESQGVEFRRGKLLYIEVFPDRTVLPVVLVEEKWKERWVRRVPVCDYYVLALPAEEIQRIVNAQPALAGETFDRIRALELGDTTQAETGGMLRHMSGIQLYFRSDIKFLPGHTVYPDSDWRLSSIFQPQFWTRKRGWWDGYRGVLSVDICDWHTPSRRTGRAAWESTADEIQEEVWRQIKDTLDDQQRIPEPILYHIDENILFKRTVGERTLPSKNTTGFLVNPKGTYGQRPADFGPHYGSLVLAGTYMQTSFRVTCMETANESGRLAANAILEADRFRGDKCKVVNPEDREPRDLRSLVELDEELYRQGLPHFLDILGLDALPRSWLWSPPDPSTLGLPRPY